MKEKNNRTAKSLLVILLLLLLVFLVPYFFNLFVLSRHHSAIVKIDAQDGFKLLVGGERYVIKGVCYAPIPVGKDYEYNFWGDSGKPWLVDGKLMKEAGVNTVRFYRVGKNPQEVRKVLDDLYGKFGIRVLLGHYLGFWDWPPPNYADEAFREKVRTEVLEMVRLYKDSPAVLLWALGNENNYSFDRNVQRWTTEELDALPLEEQVKEKAKIYYSYINSLAREIKKIDPNHPVVLGVGEVKSLEIAREAAPDIDVIGMIAYRGPTFGNLFRQIKQKFDKPVVMIEWGADGYNAFTRDPDEENQAGFLKTQWQDIVKNSDPKSGTGNSLGGTLFEWTDEWWKGNENIPHTWSVHDTAAHWYNNSYYFDADVKERLNMNEEWWGIVSLDPKKMKNGNVSRVPKKSYYALKSLWTKNSRS